MLESLVTQGKYGRYAIDPTMWSALNSARAEVRRVLQNDEPDIREILEILIGADARRFH